MQGDERLYLVRVAGPVREDDLRMRDPAREDRRSLLCLLVVGLHQLLRLLDALLLLVRERHVERTRWIANCVMALQVRSQNALQTRAYKHQQTIQHLLEPN